MSELPKDDKPWIDRLGECTGNHHESMVAVAEGLVMELPDVSQRLRVAIAGGTPKEIERYGHTLKSCLKYVSSGDEVALAEEIERCGRESRVSDAVALYDQLQPTVQAWQDRVQQWLDRQ
ncbi:Hpt domain protein [Rosistilla oblonga]|uniref:Hpt domain protein n=3 Tax=Rosistilla TaxID=2795779 RepID=A0A518IUD8_9BACT|nr:MULTISPECIES: Hpt domain-containing protein [Rosistilla]QDS90915.1 Hpt domain protein [Rosistilla ulvae]QDV15161.1 Hpt domain protein [Rosistilla oblonga]QDV56688.1 Hpt domain protein [Rosistilla oblonga]QDV71363.1 Hpt domain protein [Rosistilla carotiformis]